MYTVVGTAKSRAFRVLWMLEESGLPYEHVKASPRSDEVNIHNPRGKVPVLLDGDVALIDSTAILAFLADRHGVLTHPAGSHERARQDARTFTLLDEIDALIWTAAKHSFVLPEERRMPGIKESLRWEFQRHQAFLAEDLGDGPFLTGEMMTFADIIAGHCLGWAIQARFPIEEPALADYLDRLRAREAYKRASEMT